MRYRISVLLLLIIILFNSSYSLASIDTQLVLVSNTHGVPTGSQGTLIIDVEAKSDASEVSINSYQDKFYLDATLRAQIAGAGDVTFSAQRFPSSDYTTTENYNPSSSPAGRVQYIYTFNSGTRATIPTSWTQIVRVTIVYTLTTGNTTIAWGDHLTDNPAWWVTDSGDSQIRGSHEPIPSGLQDVSLPVQMASLSATASPQSGVLLSWITSSEVNTAGFHVWKSSGSNDAYQKITTSLIPSQGNSSSAQDYSYNDSNVQQGIRYWYKIEEIPMEGSSTFYGPIVVDGVNMIPTMFDLGQNYPNPFNPQTTIDYQLPENTRVMIRIYNLVGQLVRELVNKEMPAGYFNVTWDGLDERGIRVSTGIYLVRMQTDSFAKVRKMTIIR